MNSYDIETNLGGSSEYRDGAIRCRAVLKMLAGIDWGDGEQTDDEYFAKQHAAIAAILSSAGNLSEQAAGAMAALAEFIVCSEQDKSYIDLESNWKPWAAMTSEEQSSRRAELAEY